MSHGCSHCEKSYVSKSSLTRHIRNKHPEELDCDYECPKCAEAFPSERGRNTHHKTVHGESIAGVEVECDWCGGGFRKPRPNYEKTERSFCPDKDCYAEWQSENRSGEDSHRWKPKVENECEWCGGEYTVQPHAAENTRFCSASCRSSYVGSKTSPTVPEKKVVTDCEACESPFTHVPSDSRRFCSHDCYGDWLSENNTGENHPRWKGPKTLTCDNCGDSFKRGRRELSTERSHVFCSIGCRGEWLTHAGDEHPHAEPKKTVDCDWCSESITRPPSLINDLNFCSPGCQGEWMSENNVGENHPRWRGGGVGYYGPNWPSQRTKARERDGRVCQDCGMSNTEHHAEWGEDLHVHHIHRFHSFDSYREANKLSNLVSLCRSCHLGKWEQLPGLRPQTAD